MERSIDDQTNKYILISEYSLSVCLLERAPARTFLSCHDENVNERR